MKTKATFLKAERSSYQKDGRQKVAHRMTVITEGGDAGQFFLGGDTEKGNALYSKVAAFGQGQQVELTFGFSAFRGDLRVDLQDVQAVK